MDFSGQDVYKGVSLSSTPMAERGPKQEWAELTVSLGQPMGHSGARMLSRVVLIWAELARSPYPGFDPSLGGLWSGEAAVRR